MIDITDIKSMTFAGVEALQIVGATTGLLWEKEGGEEELPYTPVECVSATGNAFVNTGVAMNTSPRHIMDIQGGDGVIIANGYWASSDGRTVTSFVTGATPYEYSLGVFSTTSASTKLNIDGSDSRLRQKITYKSTGTSVVLSSSLGGEFNYTVGLVSSRPFCLFSQNEAGSALFGEGDYYGYQAFDSNENLIRDYQPCIYNDVVGFWDKVADSFVGNSNSVGNFYVPTAYSQTLMQLSIQPDGTQEQQQLQLLAIGAE